MQLSAAVLLPRQCVDADKYTHTCAIALFSLVCFGCKYILPVRLFPQQSPSAVLIWLPLCVILDRHYAPFFFLVSCLITSSCDTVVPFAVHVYVVFWLMPRCRFAEAWHVEAVHGPCVGTVADVRHPLLLQEALPQVRGNHQAPFILSLCCCGEVERWTVCAVCYF